MPTQNDRSPDDAGVAGPHCSSFESSADEAFGFDARAPFDGQTFEAGMPPFEMDSDTVLQILRYLHGESDPCERTGFSASALGATRGRASWRDREFEV